MDQNPASFDAAKRRAIAEPLDEKDQALCRDHLPVGCEACTYSGPSTRCDVSGRSMRVARVLDVNGVPELVASLALGNKIAGGW